MAADALATQGARLSAVMVLAMWDERFLVLDEEEFVMPVPSQCQEI